MTFTTFIFLVVLHKQVERCNLKRFTPRWFPTTEGYTSSCKDKASQKTEDGPKKKQELTYNFPKKENKTEKTRERKHNPQKAAVDEKKAGMMRKQRKKTAGNRKHK